jgi:hypothetical protein
VVRRILGEENKLCGWLPLFGAVVSRLLAAAGHRARFVGVKANDEFRPVGSMGCIAFLRDLNLRC